MTKTVLSPTAHLTTVEDWGAHHRVLCDFILHTAVYVYGVLGCKDLKVQRTRCISDGHPSCQFETLWS
jgi:hypothetical protein